MTRSYAELADSFERQAASKRTWLKDFSTGKRQWPQHDIDRKRDDMECLEEGARLFRRAAEKEKTA